MSYPEGGAVNPARFYDSPMARILVVGASGYVGRELCRVATAAGHDVVGTRLRGTPAPGDDARVLDVTDAAAISKDLSIDQAWDLDQVQDLLNHHDLLWNDVVEYRRHEED